jgi:hypothetical protein
MRHGDPMNSIQAIRHSIKRILRGHLWKYGEWWENCMGHGVMNCMGCKSLTCCFANATACKSCIPVNNCVRPPCYTQASHKQARRCIALLIWPNQDLGSIELQAVSSVPLRRGRSTYRCQKALRNETRSCVQKELHLGYLLVYLLHELYNEVYKLVLQHLLRVEVGNQE